MFRSLNLPGGITRIGTFGQPYHGLAEQGSAGNASVDLPNSTTLDLGKRFANGNTYLAKRPGWSAVSRTGDAATRDTANGWTWPAYWIFGGFFEQSNKWVFFDTDGSAWSCYAETALLRLYFKRFGLFTATSHDWDYIAITPSATTMPSLEMENHSPDGSRACFRDAFATRKLFEITLAGSGGAGPTTATTSEIDLVISRTYAIDKTEADVTDCMYEGNDFSYMDAASESLDLIYIAKSAYIGTTLSHDIITLSASMDLSQSNSCTFESCPNEVTGDLEVTWAYSISLRKDAGIEVSLLAASVHRTVDLVHQDSRFNGSCPAPFPANESDLVVTDTITIGATSWSGSYTRHDIGWVNNYQCGLPYPSGPPTLAAKVGIGEYSMDTEWENGAGIDVVVSGSISSTPPDFCRAWVVFSDEVKSLSGYGSRLTVREPTTGTEEDWTPEYDCGIQLFGGDFAIVADWGGYAMSHTHTTNNILTIKKTLQGPSDASATVSWGPCIATEDDDATVLTAASHWASYHPVNKVLERSTSKQLCWI